MALKIILYLDDLEPGGLLPDVPVHLPELDLEVSELLCRSLQLPRLRASGDSRQRQS